MVEGKYNILIPLRSIQVSDSTRNEQGHETLKGNSLTSLYALGSTKSYRMGPSSCRTAG